MLTSTMVKPVCALASVVVLATGCAQSMAGPMSGGDKSMVAASATPAASLRVALNSLFGEHVILAAAATGAALDGRDAEFKAATDALDDQALADLTYTVFDTETTGLNPAEGDEIIAVGAVRIVNGRLLQGETFASLVDPQRSLSEASVAVHRITSEMLRGQPPIEQVLPPFHRFAEETVLVGHNAAFDMRFLQLKEAQGGVRFEQPVLDTLLLSAVAHPAQTSHGLEEIAARLGVAVTGRHTALGDAMVTAEVFLRLLPLLAERGIGDGNLRGMHLLEGLVISGSTGEAATCTVEERRELWAFVRDRAKKRAWVVAGTGTNSTADSIALTRMAEELGLWPQAADALSWLGRSALHSGDLAQARELLERAMCLAAEQSYQPGQVFAEIGLGQTARREGKLEVAEAHIHNVLETSRRIGSEPDVARTISLSELGFIAEQRGDPAAARSWHMQCLTAAQKLGDPHAVAQALTGLAGAKALGGQPDRAARLLGAADAAWPPSDASHPPGASAGAPARLWHACGPRTHPVRTGRCRRSHLRAGRAHVSPGDPGRLGRQRVPERPGWRQPPRPPLRRRLGDGTNGWRTPARAP